MSKLGVTSLYNKLVSQQSGSDNFLSISKKSNPIEVAQAKSSLYKSSFDSASPNKLLNHSGPKSSGAFNFTPLEMDANLKRDLKVIEMRNYMDPKRFYKNPDKIKKVLHVGTVIEGSAEFKSSRINRKDRKRSIVDEALADSAIKAYTKKKYSNLQDNKSKIRKIRARKSSQRSGGKR